jgi:predicted XRE-type DNA-binding protein
MSVAIGVSSGNRFIDLEDSPEEAAVLQMRAELMSRSGNFIATKKLTQASATKILAVDQSGISDPMRGKGRDSASKCWSFLPREPVCRSV